MDNHKASVDDLNLIMDNSLQSSQNFQEKAMVSSTKHFQSDEIIADVTNFQASPALNTKVSYYYGKGKLISTKLNTDPRSNRVALNFKRKQDHRHFYLGKPIFQNLLSYLRDSELAVYKENMGKIVDDLKYFQMEI